ncbi:hypothetical protein [Polyangium mundeleinium]|uniref:Uncharacterized protein n=1 Tax=Polyangium mundeleinium TaxID=2995306 RepID=A0ABT5F3W0_9BACT|nr:hypothetical protein [Polyangium mundeleinium]MDC0747822.1 hypothetical protein [Polyangium mundeleinium]
MSSEVQERLEAARKAAEAEVERLKAEHDKLAEKIAILGDDSPDRRSELRRRRAMVVDAREALKDTEAALRLFEKTGKEHAIVAEGTRVFGSIAVRVPPGTSHEARGRAIDEELAGSLGDVAAELGVVLAAAPSRYTRERPGRDAEGRTVLDVYGRVEGDTLVPAISSASRNLRT